MGNLVRVYDMQKDCVRVDTTTVKSYAEVNEQGLLQLGYSKDHRPDLGQLKIALASLDPLGMPLATEVLSGECADDPVYEPIIARVREGLGKVGMLYVGDCKMASLQTRASIQFHGDFYLCPLSAVQVPPDQIQKEVDKLKEQGTQVTKVERLNDKGERVCIAQGYEINCNLTAEVNGQREEWTERRFLIQSTSGAEAAKQALLERLKNAEDTIHNILVRKQGKPRLVDRMGIDEAIKKVKEKYRVEELLITEVLEERYDKHIRAYKGKLPEVRQEVIYTIKCARNEEAIAYAIDHLSWRVYVTNQKTGVITLEQAVETYRHEYRVERDFGRIKGHPLSLAPMYVQRDDHRIGLVRLLTIALRVLTLLEGIVRKKLQEQKKELTGLYAGNPKRRTAQPTAELLLKAFDEVTLTIVSTSNFIQRHIAPLSLLQQEILSLLGFSHAIYGQLTDDS
jgi:transposase